jgi:hypothetical protein
MERAFIAIGIEITSAVHRGATTVPFWVDVSRLQAIRRTVVSFLGDILD